MTGRFRAKKSPYFMNLLVFNIRTDADHPTQAVTTRWLKAFSRYYERIFVITIHAGRLDLPDNVEVYPLKRGDTGRPGMILRFYSLLFSLLLNHKVDAVFVHQAVLLGALAGPVLLIRKIPMVMWRSHKGRSFVLRVCHFFCRAVITSSKDAFPFKSRKLIVSGHGIDTDAFAPREDGKEGHDGPFIIGYVGRYSPVKRIEILLQALSILIEAGYDEVKVHLYGLTQNSRERKYFQYLENLVKERDLKQRVIFHGAVSNWEVPGLMQGFDLMVSQQKTGGTDKAVLECMSAGVPLIMATESFNSYLPNSVVNKLIFPSGTPEEMASKMAEIIRMGKRERSAMGRTLREVVENHHSLKHLGETVLGLFRDLTVKRDSHGPSIKGLF